VGCEGKAPYYTQLSEINQALSHILKAGLGPLSEPYQALYKLRGEVMGRLGLKAISPRNVLKIASLIGFSPGEVRVFFDSEVGWIAEGRKEPEGQPVLRHITPDQAINLMSSSPDPNLVHQLMELDPYVGE
jgi:hypothetical protein